MTDVRCATPPLSKHRCLLKQLDMFILCKAFTSHSYLDILSCLSVYSLTIIVGIYADRKCFIKAYARRKKSYIWIHRSPLLSRRCNAAALVTKLKFLAHCVACEQHKYESHFRVIIYKVRRYLDRSFIKLFEFILGLATLSSHHLTYATCISLSQKPMPYSRR